MHTVQPENPQMREAVIVATARTPIGKAYRGAFNDTDGPTLAATAIEAAVARAGVEPGAIEDLILGCALTQGSTGVNVARHALLAAGLPVTVPGATIDRQCASGLSAIAAAASQIAHHGQDLVVAGGVDSISLVQNEHMNMHRYRDRRVAQAKPEYYLTMIETAEIVAGRCRVTRERQDEYALASQQRTAAAHIAGAVRRCAERPATGQLPDSNRSGVDGLLSYDGTLPHRRSEHRRPRHARRRAGAIHADTTCSRVSSNVITSDGQTSSC